jgi:hypothetical protein
MPTQTESPASVFEQAFECLRKASEANLEMQQELFQQWGAKWPGLAQPQNVWVERARKFQAEWAKIVKELLNRHREILDEQYDLALESLDEAFRVAESSDPREYAKHCEDLCKKSLRVLRDAGELQLKETQEALTKWLALAVKAAGQ